MAEKAKSDEWIAEILTEKKENKLKWNNSKGEKNA